MAYIYKIENKLNHKVYIGKTTDTIKNRWQKHIADSQKEDIEHRPLYKAFKKYGIQNFSISLLEECSSAIASQRECYWIEFYQSFKYGYNATKGGDGTQYCDYLLIKNTYLQLKSLTATAQACNVDIKTVHRALNNYKIIPKTAAELNKERYGKSVLGINVQNQNICISCMSLKDAARTLCEQHWIGEKQTTIKNIASKISSSIKRNGTAYGFKWQFLK